MRWQKRIVTGWGRSSQAAVTACRPERLADIRRALLDVGAEGIVAFAGGRSYGDAALNDGGRVLLTRRLDRLLAFDPESGELECYYNDPRTCHIFYESNRPNVPRCSVRPSSIKGRGLKFLSSSRSWKR
jgi:hypothetical protein